MAATNESLAVLKGLLSSGTVSYQAVFSKAFRSIPIGVYLSQMYFWQENSRYKGRETHQQFEGRTFICRTAEEWFEETGMTTEQQTKARETLRPFGVLLEKKAGMPAKLWQHINLEALVTVINRYLETGSAVTVDHRSKERYFTRASNGRILSQAAVKNRTTYNRELESLESKEESGRENAPLPPAGETFTFGAEKSNEPLQGGGAAGGPGRQPTPRGGNPEDWTWVDDPAPAHVTTYAVPTSETFEAAPGGPTYRAEVHAPAEREVVTPKAKAAKAQPQPRTVEIPESHAAVAQELTRLLCKKHYLQKSAERLAAEMGWLFSKPVAFALRHIQDSLSSPKGAWAALDFTGCEDTFTRWQRDERIRVQAQQGPGASPQTMQRNQHTIHQSPIFGERRL